MTLLAIDPGSEQSAFVLWNGERIRDHGKLPNRELLAYPFPADTEAVCIEMVACYGMPVGKEIFDTAVWVGRYFQKFGEGRSRLIYRKNVKLHLCQDSRAKDGNIRQALLDRIGPSFTYGLEERTGARGQPLKPKKVRIPGPTADITADEWAALAVAVYAWDKIHSEAMEAVRP